MISLHAQAIVDAVTAGTCRRVVIDETWRGAAPTIDLSTLGAALLRNTSVDAVVFAHVTLEREATLAFARALAHTRAPLTSLMFNALTCDASLLVVIMRALIHAHTRTQYLSVDFSHVRDDATTTMAMAVESVAHVVAYSYCPLRSVYVTQCWIHDDAASAAVNRAFVRALAAPHRTLQTLEFVETSLGAVDTDDGIEQAISRVHAPSSLTGVKFDECHFSSARLARLVRQFAARTPQCSVNAVSFTQHATRDVALFDAARAMATTTQSVTLHTPSNDDSSLSHLAAAMRGGATLRLRVLELGLAASAGVSSGVAQICAAIATAPPACLLAVLALTSMALRDATPLARALAETSAPLQRLDVRDNLFDDTAVALLADGLRRTRAPLIRLDVSGNVFGRVGMRALRDAIEDGNVVALPFGDAQEIARTIGAHAASVVHRFARAGNQSLRVVRLTVRDESRADAVTLQRLLAQRAVSDVERVVAEYRNDVNALQRQLRQLDMRYDAPLYALQSALAYALSTNGAIDAAKERLVDAVTQDAVDDDDDDDE